MVQPLPMGFTNQENLGFVSFLSEHGAFYSPSSTQIYPHTAGFLQPPPILSNVSSPHSVSVFISSHPLVLQGPTPFLLGPTHTLALVVMLFSLTFPARPSFLAL